MTDSPAWDGIVAPRQPEVKLEATDPLNGCEVCSTQSTSQLCPCHGRRCPEHLGHPEIVERAR